jgi:basic membrane protein A
MPKRYQLIAMPVVLLSLLVACSNDDPATDGGNGGGGCTSDLTVGLALDVGGLGDNGFNDLANAGMEKAIRDGVVCEENTKLLESNSEGTNLDENVQSLADAGFDLIVGTGYAFSDDGQVNAIAPDYPDISFAIIDGFATCGTVCGLPNDADAIPNVVDLTFKEEEGSYLVGVAAALKADELKCDTLGFLGGQTGSLIEKFEAGFVAGAQEITPSIEVLVEYIGDTTQAYFNQTAGEALSNGMYDDGACIIYHAAGDSGNGLFKAATAQKKLAIGVDADQYKTVTPDQAPYILTSMIKRVDTATYDTIAAAADGTFEGGTAQVFDMASEGISYSKSNTDLMTQDIIDTVEEYKQKILDGEIVPPEKP